MNESGIEILFIGTGSCTPTPKNGLNPHRFSSGFLVELEDRVLMFDIGSGALQKMLMQGIDILEKPTYLFITHFHPDHCVDLIPLMQARYVAKRNGADIQALKVYGPKGLIEFFENITRNIKKWSSFDNEEVKDLFNINELEDGSVIKDSDFTVSGINVKHFEKSMAYKLEANNKVIVYSGDMGYEEKFSSFGENADLAIIECSYPNKESLIGIHLYPEAIGKLSELGKFKHIVLTHLYPTCEGHEEEIMSKIQQFTKSKVTVASDLMKLEL